LRLSRHSSSALIADLSSKRFVRLRISTEIRLTIGKYPYGVSSIHRWRRRHLCREPFVKLTMGKPSHLRLHLRRALDSIAFIYATHILFTESRPQSFHEASEANNKVRFARYFKSIILTRNTRGPGEFCNSNPRSRKTRSIVHDQQSETFHRQCEPS